MDNVNPLVEVVVKMKFWAKDDTLGRCQKAGIPVHVETEAEYQAKRESQKKDGMASGLNIERYGRRNAAGDIVYDAGVQIAKESDVNLENFRRDLELQGFKLVGLEVFQGFGGKTDAYFFTSTYAKDNRQQIELTQDQRTMLVWFYARLFGNVYVWRNFNGAQYDIPAMSIHQGSKITPIELRLMRGGRELKLGNTRVEVAFIGD